MNHMGRNDGMRSHWDTFFYPKDRLWLPITTSTTYYRNKWSLSFTVRKNVNEATDKRKLFTGNRHMTLVQDGAPAHAAKATHARCKKNLPNFIEKPCCPPNFPGIIPVENLWSIMDEVVYKDPTPKTMKDLKRRLKQAWKKIPLSTPHVDTWLIPLHAATASERHNKQRRACRILTFQIYVLTKPIDVFKKFHAEL